MEPTRIGTPCRTKDEIRGLILVVINALLFTALLVDMVLKPF